MSKFGKRWQFAAVEEELSAALTNKLGISPIVAQILINRGITDERKASLFLDTRAEHLTDPFLMRDMNKAVERIARAITFKQKITIYGDYDVDGITATALLMRVLTDLGAVVSYYIPERQNEGYGLNKAALEHLIATGTMLMITVDCGISAIQEVEAVKDGLDIIITDHHQPTEHLPPAFAILNPKQPECSFPHKQLAGVGVAFKLCQALWKTVSPESALFQKYLDIVALGTIADIVPLVDENRILVKLGLVELESTVNKGLCALIEVCDLAGKRINAGKVGFVLAPRLNAAGRISHAAAGVELLITDDYEKAQELALILNHENTIRQNIEREIFIFAEQQIEHLNPYEENVLVIAGEDWHSGVIGIVASRLVEKYYRPVVMLTIKDGIAKGSCRSIPGFDIFEALQYSADLLNQFGGHRQAAGLTMDANRIEELRCRLMQFGAERLSADDYIPKIAIDSQIGLADVDKALLEQLACLEPHGMGNPGPVFASSNLQLGDVRSIGQNQKHLKLKLNQQQTISDVIGWNLGDLSEILRRDDYIDLAFIPEFNDWQGVRSVQLRARDIQFETDQAALINQLFAQYATFLSDPSSWGRSEPQATIRLANPGKITFQLEDARQISDKLNYLYAIIANGSKTLVVVNNRHQAYILAAAMREKLPQLASHIGFYSDGLSEFWKKQVYDLLHAGQLTMTVVAGDLSACCKLPDINHVVLFYIPADKETFIRQCLSAATTTSASRIHLLFGSADLPVHESNLAAKSLDRSVVGYVYRTLKSIAQSTATIHYSDSDIAQTAGKLFSAAISTTMTTTALTVLQELQLIQIEEKRNERIIRMLPAPEQKLDLKTSGTYSANEQKRELASKFAHEIVHLPVAELQSWIDQRLFSDTIRGEID